MKPFERATPWEILGLEPGATLAEVRRAYEQLAVQLAPGSLALYSAAELDEQHVLHQHLRAAYLTLLHTLGESERPGGAPPPDATAPAAGEAAVLPPSAPDDGAPAIGPDVELTGLELKRIREARGLPLAVLSDRTRIRTQLLEALESEAFDKLPERVFVRGFVMSVARELGLDPNRAWATYGARWESWAQTKR